MTIKNLMVSLVLLCIVPSEGNTARIPVNCDAGEKIQAKLDSAKPGDTLLVSGTCNENLRIEVEMQRITLDGQGKATINGPDAKQPAVLVLGRETTIKGLTISGGTLGSV